MAVLVCAENTGRTPNSRKRRGHPKDAPKHVQNAYPLAANCNSIHTLTLYVCFLRRSGNKGETFHFSIHLHQRIRRRQETQQTLPVPNGPRGTRNKGRESTEICGARAVSLSALGARKAGRMRKLSWLAFASGPMKTGSDVSCLPLTWPACLPNGGHILAESRVSSGVELWPVCR